MSSFINAGRATPKRLGAIEVHLEMKETDGKVTSNNQVVEYFKCPSHYAQFGVGANLSLGKGYFSFQGETLYGKHCQQADSEVLSSSSNRDAGLFPKSTTHLPFDLNEIVDNLRKEIYLEREPGIHESFAGKAYYSVRPLLPVAVRKHLQKFRLRGWEKIKFPHWPVDRTVDNLMEQLLLLSLRTQNLERIPFIWFWPEGAPGCALMTHDVESAYGVEQCRTLMDANDSFGIKASFQVIPEERYHVTSMFLESIRQRGFEVVVHDLNHDGRLFHSREQFSARAAKINAYGKQFGAAGFRAGVLYRNQSWFDLLDFQYDMSVPNVAHLDPQRGGCCTVMPYFVGHVLELPVTMTQDYTLFNILNQYSTDLWERQIQLIMEKHGLIDVVIHPDYITGPRERQIYESLLARLAELKQEKNVWVTTPGEVNRWWRQRAAMTIVESNGQVRIEGAGKERACLAYATERNGRLAFDFPAA